MRFGKRIISCFLSFAIAVTMMCGLFVVEAGAWTGTNAQITERINKWESSYSNSWYDSANSYGYGGKQCWRYANDFANRIFETWPDGNIHNVSNGYEVNGWKAIKDVTNVVLEPGDLLRRGTSDTDGHTGIVWKIEDNIVYFVQSMNYDSNGDGKRDQTKGNWGQWGGTGGAKSGSSVLDLLSGNFVGVWKHPGASNCADLGTDFYAYIINTEAWKHLTAESNNNVDMRKETGADNQIWHFIRKSDGTYKIVNCENGLVLDSGDENTTVYTYKDNDNEYQSWRITGVSGAYYFRTKNSSNKVIDIVGGSTADGANAQMFDCNGSAAQKFQIWPLNDYKPQVESIPIYKANISQITEQKFTGAEIRPTFTITDGLYTLKEGTDYTVTYVDNVSVGTATVIIFGKGKYSGSTKFSYVIVSSDINSASITSIAAQKYTGLAITPAFTLKNGSYTLKEGTDYTVSYENNINVGIATVYITGKGGYTGTKTYDFSIYVDNTAIIKPTITTDKANYTVGDKISITWAASPSGSNLSHYWLTIVRDGNDYIYGDTMNKNTSYSFIASKPGQYTVTTYATPIGSKDGEGSLIDTKTFIVSDNPYQISEDIGYLNSRYERGSRDLYYTSPVMTGDDVRWLQTCLGYAGISCDVDGSFGPGTKSAVQEFQKKYGLSVDGSAGSITQNKLAEVTKPTGHTLKADSGSVFVGTIVRVTATPKDGRIIKNYNFHIIDPKGNDTVYRRHTDNVFKFLPTAGTGTYKVYCNLNNDGGDYTNPSDYITIEVQDYELNLSDATITGIGAEVTYTASPITPSFSVKYDSNILIKGADYSVSYDNNLNVGTASVTVTGMGNYTGSKTVYFKIIPKDASYFTVPTITDYIYTGSTIEPAFIVNYNSQTLINNIDYTYSVSNNLNVGTATLTITGKGNYTGTKTAKFSIVAKNASTLTIATIAPQTYTGSAIIPTVTVNDGNKVLTKDTDYTVSYNNNINVGKATVTVSGKGNYTGTNTIKFDIVAKNVSGFTISAIASQTYTGSAITPVISVKDGSKLLTKDTDYIVSYSDNINVGKATITVTGKGVYAGIRTATFEIIAKNISCVTVEPIGDQPYTGTMITPDVIVKDGAMALVNDTDYVLEYSNNTNVGTATVTIIGKSNYSGEKISTFKIVAKDSFTISPVSDQIYTGSVITPAITVMDKAITLVNGTDYSVSYSNNTNVGTATITVTGKGKYSGTKTTTFKIVAKNISGTTITPILYQTYTGSAITPTLTVKDGTKTLVSGTDYTVTYSNNTNVGTATVTITGKGNYTGTKTIAFEIIEAIKSIKSFTVKSPSPAPKFYTGDAFDPSGYTLLISYDDKSTETIDLTLDMVSGYDPNKSGSQKLTVTYGGIVKKDAININVTAISATKITIKNNPTKMSYFLGDAIDLTGGVLNVTYNSGKSEEVPMTDARVTTKGFDSSKTGTKKVTITLLGKSVTVNMEIAFDPNNAPVVIGTNGYETIAEALKYNTTGEIEIVVNCDLAEIKAITLPKTLTSATLQTVPGKTLKLLNLTITANCDLTIDAAIEPTKTGKTITVKSVADKKVTITRLDSSLPLTLSGTKTTDFMLATGKTIDIAAANTVNVDIAAGTTVRLTKVTFKPTKLTGAGTLEVNDASTVTITDVKDSNIILNQYNKISGKNTTVMLPKLTIGTASNANITVYDTGAALADISGKSVFTLAKNSTDSVVPGITIVNKSGTNTLSPVPYKKDVRAEWTGALTMTCDGAPTDYSSFEKALEAITANAKTLPNADYVITMNESVAVTKFDLPAKAGSLTIDGNGNALTLTGITNIAPKYALTLNNIALNAQTNKGVANVLTINCSTGDTVIDGLAFTGKSLTIKGGSKNELTLGTCSAINSLTGYTTITINAPVEIEKTLTATNLTLGASANVKIDKGATLTVNKVLTGTSGANITLVDGFKPIALKGTKLDETIKGDKISLVSTDGTKFDEKQIFATKLDLYGKFDVTGIASDASYDLALQSGKAYLKAFTLEMNGKQYAFWNDVITDIDKIKNPNADYTITLLADFDIGATLKLPGKGKYHSLTIDGNGYKLTFVGNTASLTGITTLKNITITALKLNTKTKIYDSVAWTLTKNKFTLDKVGTVDLINCNEKP